MYSQIAKFMGQHGAHWVLSAPDGPHIGPMNLAIRVNLHDDVIKWNNFRVTGHLYREFTGPGEFPTQMPVTMRFDVFFDLRLNTRLNKQ